MYPKEKKMKKKSYVIQGWCLLKSDKKKCEFPQQLSFSNSEFLSLNTAKRSVVARSTADIFSAEREKTGVR